MGPGSERQKARGGCRHGLRARVRSINEATRPGWVLQIPLPSSVVDEENGATYYVVEEGDTLQSIAARLLGNEDHWTQLFEMNRGQARLNGHVLSNPNLIWPGLRLRVPLSSQQAPAHRAGSPAGGTARAGRRSPHHPAPATITPAPTTVPTTATPLPRANLPPPTIAHTSVPHPDGSKAPEVGLPSNEADLIAGIAGAAAVAVAGGVLVARRRVRRSLDEPPIPTPPPPRPIQEFADIDPARSLVHRARGDETEPISLIAFQVYRFLARHGLQTMAVLLAEQERDMVTLVLRGSLEDQQRFVELSGELEQRLGDRVGIDHIPDGDVALRVEGAKLLRLMAPVMNQSALPPLLPLGARSGDSTLYGNWRELENVLIAAMPGGGAEVILKSLLVTLVARRSPSQLRLWTIAGGQTVSPELRELPHQKAVVDPAEEAEAAGILEDLRSEMRKRMREVQKSGQPWTESPDQPELVLLVDEFGDLPDGESALELLATNGPAHGIRILAATTRAETLDEHVLGYFRTRLVLQAFEDDESTHVLGGPEASDLGSGEFFLRIDQRHPIRLRGFRISPDHLDQLVSMMSPARRTVDVEPPAEDRDQQVEDDAAVEEPEVRWGPDSIEDTPLYVEPESIAGEEDDEVVPSPGDARETERGIAAAEEAIVAADEGIAKEASEDGEDPVPLDLVNGKRPRVLETTLLETSSPADADELTTNGAVKPQREGMPLISIQCFGDFVVRSAEQAISPSGGEKASYKAWELLAFLAAQPAGAVSKEKLLAAIWPDFGGERVTNKVHAALVRLRALFARQVPGIPSEVVRLDRDGTCRLDTTLVVSDVHEFVSLLHAAAGLPSRQAISALEQARHLYKGDLLSGRETREYEWVYDRDESGVTLREHYREQCQRATKRLARLYREEGQPDLAVPLLKDLLQDEPTLEDVVRDLYRCYQDLGDLTSLIREDRHLRQALREAFGSLDTNEEEDISPEPGTLVGHASNS